ncbi:MAG: tRNA pseudouridine(55) synthase TruB [Candidatus Omnitrophica bacterium]|nr:tRNA pseudouridine(55) synthase TruB [Candidatus Omnitrophota bacterium]
MEAEGLLLLHKPSGVTSHDAVQVLRRKLAIRRIGHTGTLDPLAEGLLILLIGKATSHQQRFQMHDKTYDATVHFGAQTDTGDAEGAVVRTAAVPPLDPAQVAGVLASLKGAMVQTPPAFSAVKVHGRPAYWWARRRQPVALAERTIQVFDLSLLACGDEAITIRVECSAGTYVRRLAEAIAERLGTVGHVTQLVRRRVGRWTLEEAVTLGWCQEAAPEQIARRVLPVEAARLTQDEWAKRVS